MTWDESMQVTECGHKRSLKLVNEFTESSLFAPCAKSFLRRILLEAVDDPAFSHPIGDTDHDLDRFLSGTANFLDCLPSIVVLYVPITENDDSLNGWVIGNVQGEKS